MCRLSGDFLTKVFEGPFQDVPKWGKEMEASAADRGRGVGKTYFFYTTCPRCAKYYGKNYVVAVAEIRRPATEKGASMIGRQARSE